MKPATERTAIGDQYVIPGTERIVKPKRRTYKVEGNQFVIPGAERVSVGVQLKRLSEKPMQSRRGQVGMRGRRCLGYERKTVRWRDKGIGEKLLEELMVEPDYEWLMIDASHCKVHPRGDRGQRVVIRT